MNNAVPPNQTGMAALIGNDADSVQKIIDKNSLNLEIANDNSNIQIVISGNIDDIKKSEKIFLNNGIKKFVILNVSAAFHSKYMLKAQKELSNDIENLIFKEYIDLNNPNIINIDISSLTNKEARIYLDQFIIKNNQRNNINNKTYISSNPDISNKIADILNV